LNNTNLANELRFSLIDVKKDKHRGSYERFFEIRWPIARIKLECLCQVSFIKIVVR